MTSNRSSCSAGALLRSEMKLQAPLLLVSIAASLLTLPVRMIPFLQSLVQSQADYQTEQEFLEYFRIMLKEQLWSNNMSKFLLVALAVAAAISIFRYLHSKQQIDFYHSLPIGRGKLYAVKYLTGVIAVLPAYVISFALTCLIVCIYGYGYMLPELIACPLLILVVGFLVIYTVSVLCMIVCGNTLVAVLVMFWAHAGIAIVERIALSLMELFYPTAVLSADAALMLERMVPLLQIFRQNGTFYMDSLMGYDNSDYYRISVANLTDTVWFIAASVVCVLLILLGAALIRVRKSESAGTAIAFRGLKPPLSILIHAVLTAGGGVVLSTSYQFSLSLFALGAVIGALLAHCAVEIIYDLDFAGIKNGWKAFAIYVVVAAAVIVGMNVDITGFNSRIPDRQDIIGVNLKSNNDSRLSAEAFETQNANYWYSEEDEIYSEPRSFPMLSSDENINTVLQLASLGVDNGIERCDWYTSGYDGYTVECSLKNGATFRRQYRIPLDREDSLEEAKSLAERMRTSKEYRKERMAISLVDPKQVSMITTQSLLTMTCSNCEAGVTVPAPNGWSFAHRTQDEKQIQKILTTLKREYEQLTPQYARLHQPILLLRTMDAEVQRKLEENGAGELESLLNVMGDTYTIYHNIQNIPVYSSFTETLALLEEYMGKADYTYPQDQVSDVSIEWYDEVDSEAEPAEKAEIYEDKAISENVVEVTDRRDIAVLLKYASSVELLAYSEVVPEINKDCSIEFCYNQEQLYLSLLDVDAVNNVLQKYRK